MSTLSSYCNLFHFINYDRYFLSSRIYTVAIDFSNFWVKEVLCISNGKIDKDFFIKLLSNFFNEKQIFKLWNKYFYFL